MVGRVVEEKNQAADRVKEGLAREAYREFPLAYTNLEQPVLENITLLD